MLSSSSRSILRVSQQSEAAITKSRTSRSPDEHWSEGADAGPPHDGCRTSAGPAIRRSAFRCRGARRGQPRLSNALVRNTRKPGSGQPILLLADYQTTCGYPKIATVVSADLPAVGRRRPGDALRFAAVTVGAAEELCRAAEHQLAELVASLEPITQRPEIDLRSLYDGNLISGVVSGLDCHKLVSRSDAR
jgi:hypothetical protein